MKRLNRRTFLKGSGFALSLPLLEAMAPQRSARASQTSAVPRRMVAIETNMGILPEFFFPKAAGADWEMTPYLEALEGHRDQFTVFSGVSHPDVEGAAHEAERVFLTAAPRPGSATFRNSVSLDQLAAEHVGIATRFPSLTLATAGANSPTLSVTRSGVMIPAERSPGRLYEQLFVDTTPDQIDRRVEDLQRGRSILDFVGDSSRRLHRQIGSRDRDRLDQYFTSVRDLEQRMVRLEAWERRPKPQVDVPPPQDITAAQLFVEHSKLMLDTIRLALETDSSRLITFFLDATPIHNITHHGQQPEVIEELRQIEQRQFAVLNEFLSGLSSAAEDGQTLLDHTMVLYGTCMGSANSHTNQNLPVLLAGGGFRHGQHLVFDTRPGRNYPLPNLFVSMLQRMGIETDKFASSTGSMRGLEMAS